MSPFLAEEMGVKLHGDVKIFSYVVEHDYGREPNPDGGICTLCRCKYGEKREKMSGRKGQKNIIELAKKGDWIIGTGGINEKKSAGHGKIIYVMRVDEKPTREEFYTDLQFSGKKPERPLTEFQKNEQFALASRHFYYFGRNAIKIPKKLRGSRSVAQGFATLIPRNSLRSWTSSEENANRENTENRVALNPLIAEMDARYASRPAESGD